MYSIIAASLGYLGMAFGIIAYQSKKRTNILYLKTASEFMFMSQYLMLFAYSGALLNCLGMVRNFILAKTNFSDKKQKALTMVFLMVMALGCALTWNGPITLLALCGKMCTTISYSLKSPKLLRLFTLPSCVLWIIYDFIFGSMGGVAYEAFGMVSILIAWIRIDLIPSRRLAKSTN